MTTKAAAVGGLFHEWGGRQPEETLCRASLSGPAKTMRLEVGVTFFVRSLLVLPVPLLPISAVGYKHAHDGRDQVPMPELRRPVSGGASRGSAHP
jgi:hypothetical protein